nr:hypothetical protein CFP56_21315 [Quercus suber]
MMTWPLRYIGQQQNEAVRAILLLDQAKSLPDQCQADLLLQRRDWMRINAQQALGADLSLLHADRPNVPPTSCLPRVDGRTSFDGVVLA